MLCTKSFAQVAAVIPGKPPKLKKQLINKIRVQRNVETQTSLII